MKTIKPIDLFDFWWFKYPILFLAGVGLSRIVTVIYQCYF